MTQGKLEQQNGKRMTGERGIRKLKGQGGKRRVEISESSMAKQNGWLGELLCSRAVESSEA